MIKNHLCKKCKENLNNSLERYKNKCKKCMKKDNELYIRILPEIIVSKNYKQYCPFCGVVNCNCGSGY
jgi:ribosomal protein L16/L10AE